jgi:hypothetical protein
VFAVETGQCRPSTGHRPGGDIATAGGAATSAGVVRIDEEGDDESGDPGFGG